MRPFFGGSGEPESEEPCFSPIQKLVDSSLSSGRKSSLGRSAWRVDPRSADRSGETREVWRAACCRCAGCCDVGRLNGPPRTVADARASKRSSRVEMTARDDRGRGGSVSSRGGPERAVVSRAELRGPPRVHAVLLTCAPSRAVARKRRENRPSRHGFPAVAARRCMRGSVRPWHREEQR